MEAGLYTQREAEAVLARLIGANTANPPGNEADLAAVIRDILREAGVAETNLHLLPHRDNRASLVACLPGQDAATVVGFAGHMDTVPAGNLAEWQSDPFAATARQGRVYGRGAADMKGGLVAMLSLARRYAKSLPPVSLRLIFTADEEAGGTGIRAVRDAGWTDGLAFLFVCEPTGCRPALCEKGMLWYDFCVRGATSHASMPQQGVNALEGGFAFLRQAKAEVEALFAKNELLGRNTFTVTGARAGVKINVLPDEADFMVDVRFVPEGPNAMGQVEDRIARLAEQWQAQTPGLSITFSTRDRRSALMADREHPAVRRLLALCDAPPMGVLYFTDASLVIPERPGLPFAILGPGEPTECHKPNESLRPEEILQAAALYQRYIEACAAG